MHGPEVSGETGSARALRPQSAAGFCRKGTDPDEPSRAAWCQFESSAGYAGKKYDTLAFGFAMLDEDVHAPNEFFRISSLHEGLTAWPLLLAELARYKPGDFRKSA
jgi:acetylornithine deacetylase/succinyl-diaminopimelate desuccinylase-like protein